MSVELDVRSFLVGAGSTESTCSTSFTFVGPMRKSGPRFPVEAVTIQEYGGLMPHGFQDGREQTYRRNDVQVRVRSAPNGYVAGKARADAVWATLNRPSLASVSTSSTEYVRIQPVQSGPVFMGENDTEQPEWSINVRLESLVEKGVSMVDLYYGGSSVDIDTEAEVLANLTAESVAPRLFPRDLPITAASGQYSWVVVPDSANLDTLSVNGFPGGFTDYATVSVSGATCSVWRSVNVGLGSFVVRLSS